MRTVQLLTGIHYVHHIRHGYGWVYVPIMVGYFRRGGWQRVKFPHFHDCTETGAY